MKKQNNKKEMKNSTFNEDEEFSYLLIVTDKKTWER